VQPRLVVQPLFVAMFECVSPPLSLQPLLPGRSPSGVCLDSPASLFFSPLQTWQAFFLLLDAARSDPFRFVSARDFLVAFSSAFSASTS
jgi:hypothetical protein